MRTTRFYRGHRIVLVQLQLDNTWHAIVHERTGAIIRKDIEGRSREDALAKAEWVVETMLRFRPPDERKAG